jgi:hypothetical protein
MPHRELQLFENGKVCLFVCLLAVVIFQISKSIAQFRR